MKTDQTSAAGIKEISNSAWAEPLAGLGCPDSSSRNTVCSASAPCSVSSSSVRKTNECTERERERERNVKHMQAKQG